MHFSKPLERVRLIKRYKRFLADVERDNGECFTVHTANTGSMLGCAEPGSYIWIRDSENPKRKYRYSWELSEQANGSLIGVNTGIVNQLVSEVILDGTVSELHAYQNIRREVKYGEEGSRIDLLLEDDSLPPCYVEIKNVTAIDGRCAIFPDAVSTRGQKHLRELQAMVRQGARAVIFFCVQRDDVECFRPAAEIDPVYADELAKAVANGVQALAYRATLTPQEIRLRHRLEISL